MPIRSLVFINGTTPRGAYSAGRVYRECLELANPYSCSLSNPYAYFLSNPADAAKRSYEHFIKNAFYINSTPRLGCFDWPYSPVSDFKETYTSGRSFFEFFLREHAKTDSSIIAESKLAREYALALIALGIDPLYEGKDDNGVKIDATSFSFRSRAMSKRFRESESKDLNLDETVNYDLHYIARRQLYFVSNHLMGESPYELLRAAIYLEIHRLNSSVFDINSKAKKLREIMRDLDQQFDPKKASIENYKILRAALEDKNSALYRTLNMHRFGLFKPQSARTTSWNNISRLKISIDIVCEHNAAEAENPEGLSAGTVSPL